MNKYYGLREPTTLFVGVGIYRTIEDCDTSIVEKSLDGARRELEKKLVGALLKSIKKDVLAEGGVCIANITLEYYVMSAQENRPILDSLGFVDVDKQADESVMIVVVLGE